MPQTEAPDQHPCQVVTWREIAVHGVSVGWPTASCGYFLLALVKNDFFSDKAYPFYFGYLLFLGLMAAAGGGVLGILAGVSIGSLVGLTRLKVDLAKAVTAAATSIVCATVLAVWYANMPR